MATILVVDDEADIRTLVRYTLGIDDHEIIEAANGQEALDVVAQGRPDLIVLDVMMPEVSGWDTLAALKSDADDEVREIPVIMLTALTSGLDRAKGGIEGAVRYLAKPISPDELRESVNEALHGDAEPLQRRRAQQRALEDLARMDRGSSAPPEVVTFGSRPRLTGLESARPVERQPPPAPTPDRRGLVGELTEKQQELLQAIRRSPTVLAAAESLGMSRSNVYASLRRIARRLDVHSVAELLDDVRAGRVVD